MKDLNRTLPRGEASFCVLKDISSIAVGRIVLHSILEKDYHVHLMLHFIKGVSI